VKNISATSFASMTPTQLLVQIHLVVVVAPAVLAISLGTHVVVVRMQDGLDLFRAPMALTQQITLAPGIWNKMVVLDYSMKEIPFQKIAVMLQTQEMMKHMYYVARAKVMKMAWNPVVMYVVQTIQQNAVHHFQTLPQKTPLENVVVLVAHRHVVDGVNPLKHPKYVVMLVKAQPKTCVVRVVCLNTRTSVIRLLILSEIIVVNQFYCALMMRGV